MLAVTQACDVACVETERDDGRNAVTPVVGHLASFIFAGFLLRR